MSAPFPRKVAIPVETGTQYHPLFLRRQESNPIRHSRTYLRRYKLQQESRVPSVIPAEAGIQHYNKILLRYF